MAALDFECFLLCGQECLGFFVFDSHCCVIFFFFYFIFVVFVICGLLMCTKSICSCFFFGAVFGCWTVVNVFYSRMFAVMDSWEGGSG